MPDVPKLLEESTWEVIRRLEKREQKVSTALRDQHRRQFRPIREQLREQFLSYFVLKPDLDPSQPAKAVWDSLKVVRDGVPEQVTQTLVETLAEAHRADEAALEEVLDEAYLTGWDLQLWLLVLGGVIGLDLLPDEPKPDPLNPFDVVDALDNYEDLSSEQRLAHWYERTLARTTQQLRAAMVSGQSLDETVAAVDRQLIQLTGRVDALVANESYRMAFVGAVRAMRDVLDIVEGTLEIVEVWLTSEDELVCPICAPLHLTETILRPVVDTHPGCRCWKVPVPAIYRPNPIDYEDFIAQVYA
jgi:hypothetical protein